MKFIIPLLLLFAAASRLYGLDPVYLGQSVSNVNISDRVDVLEDITGLLTFDDVFGLDGYFTPNRNDSFNFGYNQSAFWVRTVILNETPNNDPSLWVLETESPWIYSLDLYLVAQDGKTNYLKQIKKQPFKTRLVQHRDFVLPLFLEKGKTVVLVRISGNPLHFNLNLTRFRTFYEKANLDYMLFGVYYGVVVLIILLSMALYTRARETVYVYNLIYIASMGLLQFTLNGLAFQYLWPDFPVWHEISTNFLPGLSLFCGAVLARNFLETRKNTPVMNALLYFVQAICLADMVLALFNLQTACLVLINILMLGVPALFIVMGVVCLKKGFYPARYFLLTFVLQAFLLIVFAFKDQGIMPNTPIIEYGIQIAILAQILFLSLAMFDRFSLSIKEKEKIRAEMQTGLEQQVRERTRELLKKQEEIEKDMLQASQVQQATLTKSDWRGQISYIDADVSYAPMNGKTSGDYYNLQHTDSAFGPCLAVMIADAAGHGVQAALSTMQLDIIYREGTSFQQPQERLAFMNRVLIERATARNFFTAFVAFLYRDKVVYAGAGHPFQLLVRKNRREIVRMKPEGKPLGIFNNLDYKMYIENIEPGDVLLFFTDGLVEEIDNNGEEFGENNLDLFLQEFFFGERSRILDASASEINRALMERIGSYCTGIGFSDDITTICVRILG